MPQAHFDKYVVRTHGDENVPVWSMCADGVPHSFFDSVIGFWTICMATGRRTVVALLKKQLTCQCGCRMAHLSRNLKVAALEFPNHGWQAPPPRASRFLTIHRRRADCARWLGVGLSGRPQQNQRRLDGIRSRRLASHIGATVCVLASNATYLLMIFRPSLALLWATNLF